MDNKKTKENEKGAEFYDDPLKVSEYEKMCAGYDGTELYNMLDKHLTENMTLLELGCGPGNDINYFRKKYNVTGSDLSDEFLIRCRNRFGEIPFIKLEAVSISTNKTFDCVFSNKVLHHLTPENLEKSFKRQKNVIKKNGIFAHTFWVGEKEMTMEGMLFVFHNREKLIDMVTRHYSILQTYDYKEFDEGDSIFIIAQNKKAK